MVEIVSGQDGDQLLQDAAFLRHWQDLYDRCPWATGFQTHGFSTAWYRCYREVVSPLIVRHLSSDGVLRGLLPLAVSRNTGRITPAGGHQAEYQGWLSLPEDGDRFIESALEAVGQRYPNQRLEFHYLPPGTPLEWAKTPGTWARRCILQQTTRPLLTLEDMAGLEKSLRKSGNKSRLNRLRRLGDFRFRRLDDVESFSAALDPIIGQYDERQKAMYGAAPFANDPRKKAFHLALMQVPGLLHVTTTTVGDEIVASAVGVCDRNAVYLGIVAHSSAHAEHSPGKFHLYMLAGQMVREGFNYLDLTPGEDPWKDRFASTHEPVHELTICFARPQAVLQKCRVYVKAAAKKALKRMHIEPRTIRRRLRKPVVA